MELERKNKGMDKLFRHVEPKRAIDIGAHVGNFTKQVDHRFPECKVVMVEANKNCEPYLRLLGKPYEIVALSDKTGFAELYVEKLNPIGTGASLYRENTEWYEDGKFELQNVPTKTLDSCDYFNGQPIDLIKLDVQGSELDILKGGEKTIKNTDFVLIEASLVEYNQGAPLVGEIVDKMREYGFCILDILEYHRFPHLYNGLIFQMDILFKKF
jgi:FkbM family methyltransferase